MRLRQSGAGNIEAVENREVALGTEVKNLAAAMFHHQRAGHVAGGYDGIVALGVDAHALELALDALRCAWRVGDQNDRAAIAAVPDQGFDG